MQIAGEEVQNVDLCLELMALGFTALIFIILTRTPPPTPGDWSKTNVGTNLRYRQVCVGPILITFTGEDFMIS